MRTIPGAKWRIGAILLAALGTAAVAVPISLSHAPAAQAQSPPDGAAKLEFEVASVKPRKNGGPLSTSMRITRQTWAATNINLLTLLMNAYHVKSFQISGAPDWLNQEYFDVVAKSPQMGHGRTEPMLQALLEDRFKLTRHWDSKLRPGYALVVSRSGLKIHEVVPDGKNSRSSVGGGSVSLKAVHLKNLAENLSNILQEAVADETGIQGTFDIELKWTPDSSSRGISTAAHDEPAAQTESAGGPTLFTALQQQLGLKLEARKVPVPILVIDHIERVPTEN